MGTLNDAQTLGRSVKTQDWEPLCVPKGSNLIPHRNLDLKVLAHKQMVMEDFAGTYGTQRDKPVVQVQR